MHRNKGGDIESVFPSDTVVRFDEEAYSAFSACNDYPISNTIL